MSTQNGAERQYLSIIGYAELDSLSDKDRRRKVIEIIDGTRKLISDIDHAREIQNIYDAVRESLRKIYENSPDFDEDFQKVDFVLARIIWEKAKELQQVA